MRCDCLTCRAAEERNVVAFRWFVGYVWRRYLAQDHWRDARGILAQELLASGARPPPLPPSPGPGHHDPGETSP